MHQHLCAGHEAGIAGRLPSFEGSRIQIASLWSARGPTNARSEILKTDYKAASILERLGQSLSDADLDYQAGEGIHEFIVRLGGMRHVIDFTDDLMERKNDRDLCVVILGIVERASTQSLPIHFMVRNDNFEKVMQGLRH
jgi:hypothetical protein